jgi:hypothetical protein
MVDVALFCEDRGHELFTRALVTRLAAEVGIEAHVRTVSATGGRGMALTQLRGWQRSFERGLTGKPDLLVVVVDGNCTTAQAKKREIEAIISPAVFPRRVVGCPDPHVERWCFADPAAFREVVGADVPPDPGKCERALYKNLLQDSLRAGGQPVLTDSMEVAPDIVRDADLYAAGAAQRSLGMFIDDLRAALKP